MKVYLLRHGITDWNIIHKFQGASDIPLNETGRDMARKTACGMRNIEFDRVYSSPLCRAYETVDIVMNGRGAEIIKDDRLKEMGFGVLEGFELGTLADHMDTAGCLKDFFADPPEYVAPEGGESFETVIGRCRDFLETEIYPRENEDVNVLLGVHGCVVASMLNAAGIRTMKNFWGEGRVARNCSSTILTVENGSLKLLEEDVIFYDPDIVK